MDELRDALRRQSYLADRGLATAIYLAVSLDKPLLLEGEAGVVSAHTVAGEASALLHVMAEDTQDLELCLERIRATDGISRTVTEVVLSTLFER